MIKVESAHGKYLQELRQKLHELTSSARRNRLEQAELFSIVQREGLWRMWGYPSFSACVKREFGLKARATQQLVKLYRTLVEQLKLPADAVRDLDWSKVAVVAAIMTAENVEIVLEDVKILTVRELRQKYQSKPDSMAVAPVPAPSSTAPVAIPSIAAWRREKPPDHEFFVTDAVWKQLCFALHFGSNILLKGPAGTGKTVLCQLGARAFDRELVAFNCGAMSEARSTLIGNTHLDRDKGTWFKPSRFIAGLLKPGTCILLDELSRAPRDAFNILLPLLDGQRYVALDESAGADVVKVADGVNFVATANVGAVYTGADAIDAALLDRFGIVVEMDFPPANHEVAILCTRCPGLQAADAEFLVRFANRQRELAREGEFTALVSTRTLLDAGRQIAAGGSIMDALEFCILSRFATDGGDVSERVKLLQLVQKLKG